MTGATLGVGASGALGSAVVHAGGRSMQLPVAPPAAGRARLMAEVPALRSVVA